MLGVEPPAVGESLTCSSGIWSAWPAPTFTYRWIRDRGLGGEAVIESATASTYTVEPVDQLHTLACLVTATNSAGSAEAASSNNIAVRGSKPQNSAPPNITGSPAVGATLTCQPGTWTGLPAPTYAYRWLRD